MQIFYNPHVICAVAIALVTPNLMAQHSALSQPENPIIELSEEIIEKPSNQNKNTGTSELKSLDLGKRQTLLSSSDLVGFGAATTGGSNEVVVSNISEFTAAVSKSDNYVRLASSLSGKTLLIPDTIYISGRNITIDGSDAPGAVFKPASDFKSSRVMMYATQPNIIVHNITLQANFFPHGKSNNVGGIRFNNDRVWVNQVTISGLWDDGIDLVLNATNVTISKVKIFNTDKSMNMYYPHNPNKRVSIHSSNLAGRQRNNWNQGATYVHMWNNYIHESPGYEYYAGTTAGLNSSQYPNGGRTNPGRANIISEHNVFEGRNPFIAATDTSNALQGTIQSNNDYLGSGSISGVSNVTNTATPNLFMVPYASNYNLLPTAEVKAYVLANAGASN